MNPVDIKGLAQDSAVTCFFMDLAVQVQIIQKPFDDVYSILLGVILHSSL